jgi:hypothetical protein
MRRVARARRHGRLGGGEQWDARGERNGGAPGTKVVLHGLNSSDASGGGRRRRDARALDARGLRGLSTEAGQGQGVRGGRSWPSEWKAGAGTESAGNVTEAVTSGLATVAGAAPSGVAQQPLAQKWQVFE